MRRKDVMESAVTLHLTLKEKANQVLIDLAREHGLTKSKALERLLLDSDEFRKRLERVEREYGSVR